MRLSAADIRTVTLSRERFLFRRLSPSRQKGANPQRAWLEKCVGAYFVSRQDPQAAHQALEQRVAAAKDPVRGRANGLAVRAMLDQFLAWHASEPTPLLHEFKKVPAVHRGHEFNLAPGLLYQTPTGLLMRHLWTESDVNLRLPRAKLLAAAHLLHADANVGLTLWGVERVSFWHLRRAERAAWDVAELRTQTADLTTLLDTVAATLDARRAAISGTDDAK